MHYWREIPQKHDRFALFGSPQLGIWKTHFWGVRFFGHFKAQQPKKNYQQLAPTDMTEETNPPNRN